MVTSQALHKVGKFLSSLLMTDQAICSGNACSESAIAESFIGGGGFHRHPPLRP